MNLNIYFKNAFTHTFVWALQNGFQIDEIYIVSS
jgi:hypothetical protein